MATVIFYQPFDMSTYVAWAGDTINASSVQIVTSNGIQNQSFDGNFTYNSNYDLTGGTVTGTTYFVGGTGYGTTIYQVSSLSLSAATLMGYVMAYNADATHAYILAGMDSFIGSSGDDVIKPYAGNDVVNGGNGSDTVVYRGARSGYTLTKWGDTKKTVTVAGADGSDTVKNVEYLRFDDQTVSVAALYAANAIEGGSGNDTLGGTSGDDTVFGNNGNDRLTGFAGNDSLDGGPGIDTAVYLAARAKYTVTVNGGGITVTSLAGAADGTDQLTGVERLHFSDRKLAFDLAPAGNAGQALEFIGMLAPHTLADAGIKGMILGYFDAGTSMTALCQLAIDAGLVTQLAGSAGNADLARLVFRNVIGSAADAATVDALVAYMDGRSDDMTQAQFMAAVAGLEVNQAHVNLVGLQSTGIEYL